MPTQEAEYTCAIDLKAIGSVFANEEESIYGHSIPNVDAKIYPKSEALL